MADTRAHGQRRKRENMRNGDNVYSWNSGRPRLEAHPQDILRNTLGISATLHLPGLRWSANISYGVIYATFRHSFNTFFYISRVKDEKIFFDTFIIIANIKTIFFLKGICYLYVVYLYIESHSHRKRIDVWKINCFHVVHHLILWF